MGEKISASLLAFFQKNRIIFLLAAILGLIIGKPLLAEFFRYRFISDVLLTTIFVATIHAISQKRKHVFISLGLVVPMFAGTWSNYWLKSIEVVVAAQIFGVLFVGFAISSLCRHAAPPGHPMPARS